MRRSQRALSAFLSLITLASLTAVPASAIGSVSGTSSIETTELYDGVTRTHLTTESSSKYGLENINIIEFDLAQRDLYLDVTNMRDYANNLRSVTGTVAAYNSADNGKTVIAAVNGDLWMTSAHARREGKTDSYKGYTDAVVTASLTLPRGYTVYNGEIVATSHMKQETPYEGEFWSFGVTDDYVPLIGCPIAEVTISNETKGGDEINADGINRLPANNALVMYTDKGCLNNYALDDAYEVVIDFDFDYTICHGTDIVGTVTGIYSASDSENPTMKDNRIILTSRGTRASLLSSYSVGDSVRIRVSVSDSTERNTEEWQRVTCAVGGHIPLIVDGSVVTNNNSTAYPATIVGITNSGKVAIITVDGRQSGFSTGIKISQYPSLMQELDMYSAFLLDGGGSTTLVTIDSGSYKIMNSPSDGSERSVVNSLILSYGEERAEQGYFPLRLVNECVGDGTYVSFASSVMATATLSSPRNTDVTYNELLSSAVLTVTGKGSDPSVYINYSSTHGTLLASSAKYAVVTYMASSDNSISSSEGKLYLCGGSLPRPNEANAVAFDVVCDGEWHSAIVDLSGAPHWTNEANGIRLDYFEDAAEGDVFILHSLALCSSSVVAESLADDLAVKLNVSGIEPEETASSTDELPPDTTNEVLICGDGEDSSAKVSVIGIIIAASIGIIAVGTVAALIIVFGVNKKK